MKKVKWISVDMSQMKGGLLVRPPLLKGTNYVYWKERMRIFIQTLDDDNLVGRCL